MTDTIPTVLGWSEGQWKVATTYHNLCNPGRRLSFNFYGTMFALLDVTCDYKVQPLLTTEKAIMAYWLSRRADMPDQGIIFTLPRWRSHRER